MNKTDNETTRLSPLPSIDLLDGAEQENAERKPLTPEQVENWRNILTVMFGIPASILSVEQIQQFRDHLQKLIDEEAV